MMMHLEGIAMMRAGNPAKERLESSALAGLLARVREIRDICDRASAAAHDYEELSAECDEALARKGLQRADLPRLAFERLTGSR